MNVVKFLITLVLILKCLAVFGASSSIRDPVVFDNIMRHLRANWQSPITYLKKRGYIPKNEESRALVNLKGNNVKNQSTLNINTEANHKQPRVAINDEMLRDELQQSLEKTAKLSRAYQRAKTVADAQLASLSPRQRNRLLIKKANVTSVPLPIALSLEPPLVVPTPNKMPIPLQLQVPSTGLGLAQQQVPASSKIQITVPMSVPSASSASSDLNVGQTSANALQPPGSLNNGLEAEHNVSFLHNMKEKFLGLFRNKPNDNKKDKFSTYDFTTKGQYNLNENEAEEIEKNKLIDREFQLILDKSLENHKRRHNNPLSLKTKSNKQQRHSKIKADDN